MTQIRLAYVHEYRDRHGRLRRYVRRPGSRRVALPGLPGSPEFMQAYEDAMTGPVARPRAPKAGTLAALAAEFFASTEFANLKATALPRDARPRARTRRPPARAGLAAGQGPQDHPGDRHQASRPGKPDKVRSASAVLVCHLHQVATRQSIRG